MKDPYLYFQMVTVSGRDMAQLEITPPATTGIASYNTTPACEQENKGNEPNGLPDP